MALLRESIGVTRIAVRDGLTSDDVRYTLDVDRRLTTVDRADHDRAAASALSLIAHHGGGLSENAQVDPPLWVSA